MSCQFDVTWTKILLPTKWKKKNKTEQNAIQFITCVFDALWLVQNVKKNQVAAHLFDDSELYFHIS